MYLPFFACKAKCEPNVADKQNTHNMTMAVQGIVNILIKDDTTIKTASWFKFMPKLHKLICFAIDKISPDTFS